MKWIEMNNNQHDLNIYMCVYKQINGHSEWSAIVSNRYCIASL